MTTTGSDHIGRPWQAALLGCVLALSGCTGEPAPAAQPPVGTTAAQPSDTIRVLSWNVSGDAFARQPAAFRGLVTRADADILLLDEVSPSATEAQIRDALPELTAAGEGWHIDIGPSGGRQRDVIVSRLPLERLPEFSGIVAYPAAERDRIHDRMTAANELRPAYSMDGGIPVNGAIVLAGTRRMLVVSTDLQCCGDDPSSWQEERRLVETEEIRKRVAQVLGRNRVDGLVVAGDFNLVSTPLPMVNLSGPYPRPHAGLIAASLRHLDGSETWTWDGRGSPFPSSPLDLVLYSPHSLSLRGGYILDSADLLPAEREQLGLEPESASRMSSHLPLVAEFDWQ